MQQFWCYSQANEQYLQHRSTPMAQQNSFDIVSQVDAAEIH